MAAPRRAATQVRTQQKNEHLACYNERFRKTYTHEGLTYPSFYCFCLFVLSFRFLADLSARGSSAVLRVVETNDFKQLVHIGLTLRAGSDEEVKKYLAECLQDYKVQ